MMNIFSRHTLLYRYPVMLAFVLGMGHLSAQDKLSHEATEILVPPVLLLHYTSAEIEQVRTTDTLKYQLLVYYYTRSFVVEAIDCSDCVPTDLSVFDISKYEYLRQKNERYVRSFDKYGFKLTLLSFDELLYTLPTQQARQY